MQLTRVVSLTILLLAAQSLQANAQSLSPMGKTGTTPSDIKAFRLTVGNPYRQLMTFLVVPMNTAFTAPVEGAKATPSELRLAPGYSRSVIVQFRIDPKAKERTIGVCVLPKDLEGPILPRVCGTYTGILLGSAGG